MSKDVWVFPHGYPAWPSDNGEVVPGARLYLAAVASALLIAEKRAQQVALVTDSLQGPKNRSISEIMAQVLEQNGVSHDRLEVRSLARHSGTEVTEFLRLRQDLEIDRFIPVAFRQHTPNLELLYNRKGTKGISFMAVEAIIDTWGSESQKTLLAKLQDKNGPYERNFRLYNQIVRAFMRVDGGYRILGPLADWTRQNVHSPSFFGLPIDMELPPGYLKPSTGATAVTS